MMTELYLYIGLADVKVICNGEEIGRSSVSLYTSLIKCIIKCGDSFNAINLLKLSKSLPALLAASGSRMNNAIYLKLMAKI